MGRPSTFDQTTADEICRRIARGETLRSICRDDGFPHFDTVYGWMKRHAEFKAAVDAARDTGFDAIADEVLEIADRPSPSTDNGSTDAGDVAHRKLQTWARLQLLAKWSPRYRDNARLEVTGADGGAVKFEDSTAAARAAALLAAAQARKSAEIPPEAADLL